MAANFNTSASEARESIQEGLKRGGAALGKGVNAAKESLDHAQDYLDDGLDYARQASQSLTDFVTRQPLLAIGAAFLVGYLAARMLRRVSAS
jgi:ElaB/YqjD/DUF883 family membrane-anchored ribosome-binding protein